MGRADCSPDPVMRALVRRATARFEAMTWAEKCALMVRAGLATQEEVDRVSGGIARARGEGGPVPEVDGGWRRWA